MKVASINDNYRMSFGHKISAKKTYRDMQRYYELINDKATAIEYRELDRMAKERLHNIKSMQAESKAMDLADDFPTNASKKESLIHWLKIIKYSHKAIHEKFLRFLYLISL